MRNFKVFRIVDKRLKILIYRVLNWFVELKYHFVGALVTFVRFFALIYNTTSITQPPKISPQILPLFPRINTSWKKWVFFPSWYSSHSSSTRFMKPSKLISCPEKVLNERHREDTGTWVFDLVVKLDPDLLAKGVFEEILWRTFCGLHSEFINIRLS